MIYYKSDKRGFVLYGVVMGVFAFLTVFPIMYLFDKALINIVYANCRQFIPPTDIKCPYIYVPH